MNGIFGYLNSTLIGYLKSVAVLLALYVPLYANLTLSFDFYEVGTSNLIVQPIEVGEMFDAVISVQDTVGSGVIGVVFDWTFDTALLTQTPTSGDIALLTPWVDLAPGGMPPDPSPPVASVYSATGGHIEAYTFTPPPPPPPLPPQEIVRINYTAAAPGTAVLSTIPFAGYQPPAAVFATLDNRSFFFDGTCNPASPTSCAGETVQFLTGDVQIVLPDCDFDGDGDCDIIDIDSLVMEIVAGTDDPAFDMDGDTNVGLLDRDEWLTQAGAMNLGDPYLLGDANLSGGVNIVDYGVWLQNNGQATGQWSQADFNASGSTNIVDYGIWLQFNGQSSAPPVPEPSLGTIWIVAAFFLSRFLKGDQP